MDLSKVLDDQEVRAVKHQFRETVYTGTSRYSQESKEIGPHTL